MGEDVSLDVLSAASMIDQAGHLPAAVALKNCNY